MTRHSELPKVSIIVPVFNQLDYLDDLARCLGALGHPNVETVFVNDGSTDDSGALLNVIAGPDDRVIHQSNQGLAAARNAGLSQATGEFIQFLDADDLIHPTKLTHDVRYLSDHPHVDVVTCEVNSFRGSLRFQKRMETVYAFGDLFTALLGGNPLQPHGPLLRRSALRKVSGFDTSMPTCEDWDFWLRLTAAGARTEFVPGVRAYYRLHETQMSGNPRNMLAGAELVLSRARALTRGRHREPEIAHALLGSHVRWLLRACALGKTALAENLRARTLQYANAVPRGHEHPEFAPARGLGLWTDVAIAFADDDDLRNRALQEWVLIAERIRACPDPAGIRALLRSRHSLVCSADERLADAADRAGNFDKGIENARRKRVMRRSDGAHVERVLDLLRDEGVQRILVYGGGEHTRWMVTEFDLSDFEIAGILDDNEKLWQTDILGTPVVAPKSAASAGCDAVLVSSDRNEDELVRRARQVFPTTRVYRMYAEQPVQEPATSA